MITDDELLKEIAESLLLTHSKCVGILARAGFDQLFTKRLSTEAQHTLDAGMKEVCRQVAGDLLEKIKEAGYSRPPAGDLRTQLLRLGRELKAEQWDRGYSWDNDTKERINEAKAQVKSDIGRAILDALERVE